MNIVSIIELVITFVMQEIGYYSCNKVIYP